MNFIALDFTDYTQANIIWSGGAILVGWIFTFVISELFQSKKKNKDKKPKRTETSIMVALVVAMFLGLGASAIANTRAWDSYANNKDIASENILKKYDVKEVLWKDPQTKASPSVEGEDKKNHELVVRTNNDKKYIFLYSVDKKTSEPTLDDIALPSGSSEPTLDDIALPSGSEKFTNISAKDLLKK